MPSHECRPNCFFCEVMNDVVAAVVVVDKEGWLSERGSVHVCELVERRGRAARSCFWESCWFIGERDGTVKVSVLYMQNTRTNKKKNASVDPQSERKKNESRELAGRHL